MRKDKKSWPKYTKPDKPSLYSHLGDTALGGYEEDQEPNLIVPKGKVPEAGLEYVRKLRDVKYYETIFDILARQW
jgi:hypothetical protein